MPRIVEFTDAALKALGRMERAHRRLVVEGIRTHLIENNPAEITRNKFRLRRPSPYAQRELRLNEWRVLYSVMEDRGLVLINLIGEKRGNKLFVNGEEIEL